MQKLKVAGFWMLKWIAGMGAILILSWSALQMMLHYMGGQPEEVFATPLEHYWMLATLVLGAPFAAFVPHLLLRMFQDADNPPEAQLVKDIAEKSYRLGRRTG